MTTDLRALCVELTEHLALLDEPPAELVVRAQSALAEPEPEGLTDEELLELHDWMTDEWAANHDFELPPSQFARAVLARWGRPAPVQAVEALAARPLLERVAALGDIIGEQTVGQVRTLADRAAAWLAANPPDQPVAND